MKRTLILAAILSILAISLGCNIDAQEGIFRQISKTEAEVKVGSVELLAVDGTKYYAMSTLMGLLSYENNIWTRLDPATSPIARVMATSSDDIAYAPLSDPTTGTHTWYLLDGSDVPQAQAVSRFSFITTLHEGWEIAKTDSSQTEFDLYRDLGGAPVATDLETMFSENLWLLEIDDAVSAATVLVSGLQKDSTDTYVHKLYVGGAATSVDADIQDQIVAFSYNGTDMIAVTKSGKVWYGDGTTMTEKADTTLSFPTNGIAGKPIPTFIDASGNLVFQGSSVFYSIAPNGTVTSISDRFSTNLRSSSFKVTSYYFNRTTGALYGGTVKNGLFKVPDLAGDTVDWL
ncbi:MAG: hypothetical protein RBT04_03420 [Sphaerochaetaceae bacterium]|jgi:hypothetical protein|nr:hypothetical protein [Sphaerochaetaceae bacterium]